MERIRNGNEMEKTPCISAIFLCISVDKMSHYLMITLWTGCLLCGELEFCCFQAGCSGGEGDGGGLLSGTQDDECLTVEEAAVVGGGELVAVMVATADGDDSGRFEG